MKGPTTGEVPNTLSSFGSMVHVLAGHIAVSTNSFVPNFSICRLNRDVG